MKKLTLMNGAQGKEEGTDDSEGKKEKKHECNKAKRFYLSLRGERREKSERRETGKREEQEGGNGLRGKVRKRRK